MVRELIDSELEAVVGGHDASYANVNQLPSVNYILGIAATAGSSALDARIFGAAEVDVARAIVSFR